jgi:hypothetical protein
MDGDGDETAWSHAVEAGWRPAATRLGGLEAGVRTRPVVGFLESRRVEKASMAVVVGNTET